jgi:hypothetical protein
MPKGEAPHAGQCSHSTAAVLPHRPQVDLLEDNVETVLQTLTVCFSGGGGVPELGLGEAEAACILTAWKRHMTLNLNAAKYERTADYLQILLYFLGLLTTVLAVLASTGKGDEILRDLGLPFSPIPGATAAGDGDGDGGDGDGDGDGGDGDGDGGDGDGDGDGDGAGGAAAASTDPFADWTILSVSVLFLPIVTSLVATIRGRLRPREKWATCLMACNQIVDQIYRYRLRTDPYDVNAPPPPDPDTGEIPVIPAKQRETKARKDFVSTYASRRALGPAHSRDAHLLLPLMPVDHPALRRPDSIVT